MQPACTSQPETLNLMLDQRMTGYLSGCRTVRFCAPAALPEQTATCIPADHLLDPDVINALIDRYAATHTEGTDRRGLASIWAQYFFGVLLPPLAIAVLTADAPAAADPALWRMHLSADGLPERFDIACAAPAVPTDLAAFETVIAPLLDSLHRATRLSRRVLWNSVGNVLEWGLTEQAKEAPALSARLRPALDLFAQERLSPDHPNPLYRPVAYVEDQRIRTVCCLRNRLPELGNCGNCPLTHAEMLKG
ncbi:siderophore-iron reductase FhuF [Novispirillum itersonii]|uniref:Ferric iron reductase protein FhuF n=1 Tax=Novispirillum itersonii TaxID=189 RepID=A0A7W9ZLG1_NOVIT|nr:siderophore-iron reductase FhuF [Novispirillum itersonii]MBB6212394.1 ferric iron reductase protein FhuF [Novispirillum itersonii]